MTSPNATLTRRIQNYLKDPETFSTSTRRTLRPYQAQCASAIALSVIRNRGLTFTVTFARQMGKNETSAQLEAYLMTLFAHRGGSIVKAAPSFKPQIVNSMLRLKETLDASPLTRGRWKPAFGYMLQIRKTSIAFLSADRSANVVGATASLLLEIDEAQDVDPEKYDRDFRPMASSTNATTVLYGTAWSEDSILEKQKRINLKLQEKLGTQLHFEYDWTVLARLNPAYDQFVQGEIARLGLAHPSIQTQYLLHCLSDAGRLFSEEQRKALHGSARRTRSPVPGTLYVAGIDVAGEDEEHQDAQARALVPHRDSTVVTIAEVTRDNSGSPVCTVVDHVWWTGRDQVWQYERLLELWRHWSFARVVVDASGIGAGIADFLERSHPEQTEKYVFTQPSKSALAYTMLGMLNTGRLTVYQDDLSPELNEFWTEVKATRYELRANEQMTWGVPETEGHDDFVVSLALTCQAAETLAPKPASALLRQTDPFPELW